MKIFISNQYGKERLVKAFENAGAEVVQRFAPLTDDIKLIVPLTDEELPFFARAKDWFWSKGIRVLSSPEPTVYICRDKAEFYRFCRRHNFDTPVTYQDNFIAKPRFGKGGRGQFKIDRSYILQEKIEGQEYSIDYVADFDGNWQSVIARKRLNTVDGESTACEVVYHSKLLSEAIRLGRELGICGHAVMQCFYNPDTEEIKWLEVNPRFGGGSWMTFDLFNSPKYFMNLLSKSNGIETSVPMYEVRASQAKNKNCKD